MEIESFLTFLTFLTFGETSLGAWLSELLGTDWSWRPFYRKYKWSFMYLSVIPASPQAAIGSTHVAPASSSQMQPVQTAPGSSDSQATREVSPKVKKVKKIKKVKRFFIDFHCKKQCFFNFWNGF